MDLYKLENELADLETKRLDVLGCFNEDKGHKLSENQFNKQDKIYIKKIQLKKEIKKIKGGI